MIDQIFQKMGMEQMTGIDDIGAILIDGPTVRKLLSEYKAMFDETADVDSLEDYFGAKIEISEVSINGGFFIERSI